MSIQILPNGTGEILGDSLVTGKPFYTGNNLWYVSSLIGNDTFSGNDKGFPFATTAHAYGAASAGDLIVLLDGHSESFASTLTVAKAGLTIVASGQANGKPTVKLNMNSGSTAELFAITAAGVQLRNIYFPAPQVASTGSRVVVTGAGFKCRGCYFEQTSVIDSGNYALELQAGASNARLDSTTFISTLATTGLPAGGFYVSGTSLTDITLLSCIFSGRYLNGAVFLNQAVTRFRLESPSLQLGAEVVMGSAVQSYVVMATASQDGLTQWTGT